MVNDRAQKIAAELVGTTTGLSALLVDDEENDAALMDGIDELVFCCERCDWWCWRDEESEIEDGVCDDCEEKED